jgi:hypothetical protein
MSTKRELLYLPTPLDANLKGDYLANDPALRRALGVVLGIAGGDRGYNTEGDVVTQTVDGVDLNTIWNEFRATIDLRNRERNALVDFLTFGVTNPVETVPQFGSGEDFEEASEFGEPKSMKPPSGYFQMGFGFKWYDTASRFTWKYLAEATAAQVEAVHQNILEADNRLVFMQVMRALFRNTNQTTNINNQAYNVYAFYNNDGTVPPPYKTTTFDGTHNHYLTSGAANLSTDGTDIDDIVNHLEHHGYTRSNGAEQVIMVNKAEGDIIRQYRSIANGGTAKYDFVPATNQPSFLLPENFRTNDTTGARPSGSLRGMTVIGSYGDAFIVQEDYIPAKYVVGFATGGPESVTNPIGIREHQNPALRGLRIVKGREPDYPLQDAFYQRGMGTGIRHRGAGVVMQVTANPAYAIPALYA